MTWRSLQPSIATIAATGEMATLANGDATIEATSGSQTVQATLAVRGVLHRRQIETSETWRAADSPHFVAGQLHVGGPTAPTLTIEPGATVRFLPRGQLFFGVVDPGRLVLPGGATVTFEGDSVGRGTWVGLYFVGGRHEIRNAVMRHCGGIPGPGDPTLSCLVVSPHGGRGGETEIFLDGVTISEPHGTGMVIAPFVTFGAGSRNLSITGGDRAIALLSPEAAAAVPRGGDFSGNAQDEFLIGDGLFRTSASWTPLGPAWRLAGQVFIEGPTTPTLTIPAGSRVRVDPVARFVVGQSQPGRLRIGGPTGAPVVVEPTGSSWGGIEISDGAGTDPSELIRTTLSKCGSGIQGATSHCIRLLGGLGLGTALYVDSVTIRDTPSSAILLTAQARFAPGSRGLTVTGAAGVPLALPSAAVSSIPTGDLRGNADDAIEITSQSIEESGAWHDVGVPFRAITGLAIGHLANNPILTLEPGVRVMVGPGAFIVVGDQHGALKALGAPGRPVVFSATTTGTPGTWVGIQIGQFADARTRFDWVEVLDAGMGDPGMAGAIRFLVDPGGVVTNTAIRRSATCGVILFGGLLGSTWTSDYSSPALGNTFDAVGGPARCFLP